MNPTSPLIRGLPSRGMGHVRALAIVRWRRLRNPISRHPAGRSRWNTALLKIGLVGPLALFLMLSCVLGSAIAFEQAGSAAAADTLIAALMIIAFVTMVAGCLGVSYQVLFQSREGEFLSTLPVSFRLILLARLSDFARGAAPGMLFGVAAGLGYMLAESRSNAGVVLAIPAVLILAGLSAATAVILTSIVMYLAPPKQARAFLAILGLVTLGSVALAWQSIGRQSLELSSSRQEVGLNPFLELAPPTWIARTLANAANGSESATSAYALLSLSAAVLAFLGAARAFEVIYSSVLERTDIGSGSVRPRQPGPVAKTMLQLIPRSVIHWVKREWTLIGRDFGRLSAALWPISAILFFVASSLFWDRSLLARDSADFWAVHAPILLLPWGISLGTTIFAIGSEAHEFGLARSLPTSAASMMIGKYAAYALPTAFISCGVGILSLAVAPGNPHDSSLLLGLLVWMACGCCAIDLAMSAAAPRFGAEPVQRATPFFTRVLSAVAGLVMVALVVMGIALSPIGSRSIGAAFGAHSLEIGQGGWLFALLIALLVPVTMMVTGTRRAAALLAGD